jgi:undecaprenyl-diphosphatase
MILLDEFIKLKVSPEFYGMFQVVIQLGAIMAVVILFWNKIFPFGKKKREFTSKKT